MLGLSPTSSWSEIKSAYRGLALQYHPDKHSHSSPEVRLNYEEHMKKTTEAYSLLSKYVNFTETTTTTTKTEVKTETKTEAKTQSTTFSPSCWTRSCTICSKHMDIQCCPCNETRLFFALGWSKANSGKWYCDECWPNTLTTDERTKCLCNFHSLAFTFKQGDNIKLHSLTSQSLNGVVCTAKSFDMTKGRWLVSSPNGSDIAVQPKNMQIVTQNAVTFVPFDGWLEYYDKKTGQFYYHNETSGITTWERPIPKNPPPPSTPYPWDRRSFNGCSYYHNCLTGETSFSAP